MRRLRPPSSPPPCRSPGRAWSSTSPRTAP